MAIEYFNHDMNVIGHDAPGQQAIALAIEMKQRGLHQSSHNRIPQPTLANAPIEQCLKPARAFRVIKNLPCDMRGQTVR